MDLEMEAPIDSLEWMLEDEDDLFGDARPTTPTENPNQC